MVTVILLPPLEWVSCPLHSVCANGCKLSASTCGAANCSLSARLRFVVLTEIEDQWSRGCATLHPGLLSGRPCGTVPSSTSDSASRSEWMRDLHSGFSTSPVPQSEG